MKRIATANRAVDLFAAGKDGFRQAVPGVSDATYLTALFFNHLQESIVRTIESAGLVLSDTDYDQFVTAIKKLQQTATESYAIDTGVANTYQAAYSPAVSVLADGMVLKFRAKTANTGASTFSPNGLAAAPIWGGDHVAVGGGEIIANGDVWLQWNSALNGGNGAWLLIDSTGGYLKSPTPALFDNSQKLATTGFVQTSLGSMSGTSSVSANATLTSLHIGRIVNMALGGPYTIILPMLAGLPEGATITLQNTSGVNQTVARQGTDIITTNGNALSSIEVAPGDWVVFIKYGIYWYANGSATLSTISKFSAVLSTAGYQRLPSGLIFQWGGSSGAIASGANQNVSLPIAFPTAALKIISSIAGSVIAGSYSCGATCTTTQATLSVFSSISSAAVNFVAIGY